MSAISSHLTLTTCSCFPIPELPQSYLSLDVLQICSQAESTVAKSVIQHAMELKQILDAQAAKVREILVAHKSAISQLSSLVARHKNVLNPINQLPLDILGEVFRWAVFTPDRDTCVTRASLDLSHCCRLWHEIVLGTPALWSDISIQEAESASGLYRTLPHVQRSLSRSQNHPLDLALSFTNPYDDENGTLESNDGYDEDEYSTTLESIFSVLAPHSARWRTLSLTDLPYHVPMLFSTPLSLPQLQAVDFSGEGTEHNITGYANLLENVQVLHTVSIHTITEARDITSFLSKVSAVRSLDIHVVYRSWLTTIADIHRALPDLRSLSVILFAVSDNSPPITNTFTFRCLKSLKLMSDDAGPFLEHLSCPALETLSLDVVGSGFPPFLQRSPRLRELSLSEITGLSFDDLSSSSITKLVIRVKTSSSAGRACIETLSSFGPGRSPVLPTLETLDVRFQSTGMSVDSTTPGARLESPILALASNLRRHSGRSVAFPRLRSLVVAVEKNDGDDYLRCLQSKIEAGLPTSSAVNPFFAMMHFRPMGGHPLFARDELHMHFQSRDGV